MKNNIIALTTFVLALGIISAAGIASPYWEENPLKMSYGDTQIVNLNLQNAVGTDDITVKFEIKQGSDIASLEKDTYTAKAGSSDTMVPVKITVPSDYSKQSQTVVIEAKTVSASQGGMVTLGTGWTTTFNVEFLQTQKESAGSLGTILLILVLLIIIIGAIIYVVKRRK